MELEVAALERRVAALQARLGFVASDDRNVPMQTRLQALSENLSRLESSVDPPHVPSLHAAYQRQEKLLQPEFLEALSEHGRGASQQWKKAIVLSSEESVAKLAVQAKRLQELDASVLNSTFPSLSQEAQSALNRVETQNLLVTRQVIVQHQAVESLLTQYASIVHGMSKKFQLYDAYVRQLEEKAAVAHT
ncbi:hypothetical protein H310_07489 [Aphanomyces invadans]|uniref:Uncharacterized protein n=1 Tax=Aphanomyces invadans TaxID=157072 RepID=A0A024U1D0_9STRA|nr:hypothetical protein H310_07489 [Aphanomyces invadans]ETW00059.1 hypothetical protein H310_07489 [Aphanomyces invadans]|eukprot:XP_008871084.1 hypothetical protein H310_07489 [Aphanomyces invadans]